MEGRLFFNAYYIACGKIYRLALWASALSTGGVAAHPDINSSPKLWECSPTAEATDSKSVQYEFESHYSYQPAQPEQALSWILVVKLPPARKRYVA